jgi:hypothetical protein
MESCALQCGILLERVAAQTLINLEKLGQIRAAFQGEIAQILAVMLDQVEGVEDGGTRGLPSAQLLEAGQAVGA